jgi:3',5'-cyclic AMP phosphodiesterase CpdA
MVCRIRPPKIRSNEANNINMKTWLTQLWSALGLAVLLLGVRGAAWAAEPFFFIQLTDPQFGMFTDNTNFVQETANFEFAAATVNRLRPAFVVITGDLVNKPGDAGQIAEYRRIVGKIDPSIRVYDVAGNHDVENVPTPASLASYTNVFGRDYYTFRHRGFVGIVLNSCLIHSPQQTADQFADQERWLSSELKKARAEGAGHIVVFQHHPWFLKAADEPDEYFNIPRERRQKHLDLFREYGVRYLFCGHYHRNAIARSGDIEAITTGPVGKPLGNDRSGLRVAIVRDGRIDHRYYDFGQLPNQISLDPPKPAARPAPGK